MGNARRHYPPPEFCAVLRQARAAAGWSTRRLAARAGTNWSHIAKMERGQRSPSLRLAHALIDALGLTGRDADTILAGAVQSAGGEQGWLPAP